MGAELLLERQEQALAHQTGPGRESALLAVGRAAGPRQGRVQVRGALASLQALQELHHVARVQLARRARGARLDVEEPQEAERRLHDTDSLVEGEGITRAALRHHIASERAMPGAAMEPIEATPRMWMFRVERPADDEPALQQLVELARELPPEDLERLLDLARRLRGG